MTSWPGRQVRVAVLGTVLLLLNSAYLAATASPTLFYFTNVVAHIALGVVLAVYWGRAAWHIRATLALWIKIAIAVLSAGVLAGLAIVFVGAAGTHAVAAAGAHRARARRRRAAARLCGRGRVGAGSRDAIGWCSRPRMSP